MLKSNRELSMTVRSPSIPPQAPRNHPLPPPPAWTMRQAYSWIDRQGRPCSPPLDYARSVIPMPPPPPPPPRWNYSARSSKDTVRKVRPHLQEYFSYSLRPFKKFRSLYKVLLSSHFALRFAPKKRFPIF